MTSYISTKFSKFDANFRATFDTNDSRDRLKSRRYNAIVTFRNNRKYTVVTVAHKRTESSLISPDSSKLRTLTLSVPS